ncbi:MAG: energy transducer TonB [Terriglobia bacterium]
MQAKPKYTPDPPFPDVARQQRRAGDVIISANVGVDGHLGDLCVLESAGPNFARSAIETISQWRMTPWECKGAPVERRELIDVTFRLAP